MLAGLETSLELFREVTKGIEALARMEEVETVREGIFVMPKQRVQIHSTYVYKPDTSWEASSGDGSSICQKELQHLQARFHAQSKRLEKLRSTSLP